VIAATATADRWTTLLALFLSQVLAWAGVPAIGAAAIAAGGALASQGVLHLWSVVFIGALGAELGGLVGWWLGRRVAHTGLDHPGRFANRRQQALDAGERIAKRWGPLMVFFVPSWVSGAMGMAARKFALVSSLVPLLAAAAAAALLVWAFMPPAPAAYSDLTRADHGRRRWNALARFRERRTVAAVAPRFR